MKSMNYQQVPSTIAEDINMEKTTWSGGRIRKIDEGTHETYYIGHRQMKTVDNEGVGCVVTEAYPVRVKKPFSIEKAVKSATMSAYNLYDDEAYATFQSQIAARYRTDSNDSDVRQYDEFTKWVRNSLECDELETAREKKLSEIDMYDKSKAVEEFYLNEIGMWYKADKRTTIRNLVESSMKEGRDEVTLWTEQEPIIPLTIPCNLALDLLAKLEVYAGDALAVTQKKKSEVQALTSIEEIEKYDITSGYPEKLNLQTK